MSIMRMRGIHIHCEVRELSLNPGNKAMISPHGGAHGRLTGPMSGCPATMLPESPMPQQTSLTPKSLCRPLDWAVNLNDVFFAAVGVGPIRKPPPSPVWSNAMDTSLSRLRRRNCQD
jgi:hypothetical protein